jgi:hypothetical protein
MARDNQSSPRYHREGRLFAGLLYGKEMRTCCRVSGKSRSKMDSERMPGLAGRSERI